MKGIIKRLIAGVLVGQTLLFAMPETCVYAAEEDISCDTAENASQETTEDASAAEMADESLEETLSVWSAEDEARVNETREEILCAPAIEEETPHTLTDGIEDASVLQQAVRTRAWEDDIVIAIVDTGINLSENADPESPLYGRIHAAYGGTTDPNGHGTAMAKLIACATSEAVRLRSYTAFREDGTAETKEVADAIDAAVADGADILLLSFSGQGTSALLSDAVERAIRAGCIVIAAAGNEGEDASAYTPANIRGVLTVSATDEAGHPAAYANYGEVVDIMASGTVHFAHATGDTADDEVYIGTSVAAAYAAARAAVLATAEKGEGQDDIKDVDEAEEERADVPSSPTEHKEQDAEDRSIGSEDVSENVYAVRDDAIYRMAEDIILRIAGVVHATFPSEIHIHDIGSGSVGVTWSNEAVPDGGRKGRVYAYPITDGEWSVHIEGFDVSTYDNSGHLWNDPDADGAKNGHELTIHIYVGDREGYHCTGMNLTGYAEWDISGGNYSGDASVFTQVADKEWICKVVASTWRSTDATAMWEPNAHTIYFRSNGGSGQMEKQIITYGQSNGLKGNGFTRAGYAFTGWNTKADGSGTSYAPGRNMTDLVKGKNGGSTTLYAQWRPYTYTIRFDANATSVTRYNMDGNAFSTNPTGSMASQSVTYDTTAALRANGYTRRGYQFAGWSTIPSGNARYANGASIRNLIVPQRDGQVVTLYAIWRPVTYTIRYHANGVNAGSMTDQSIRFDARSTIQDCAFYHSFSGQRVRSLAFAAWKTNANGIGGNTYYPSQTVYNLFDTDGHVLHLYAIWEADYDLLLQADIADGETNTTPDQPLVTWQYDTPAYDTAHLYHVGNNDGADAYMPFLLPDEYPFFKEKHITAESGAYYDVNTKSVAAYTDRYSQQGWSWYSVNDPVPETGKAPTYREADYRKGDYLAVAQEEKSSPTGNKRYAVEWLLYALNLHPSNISMTAEGMVTVSLYAVWDEAPRIDAVDTYLTFDELEETLRAGELAGLLADEEHLRVTDREDGLLSDGTADGIILNDGKNAITTDLNTDEVQTLLAGGSDRIGISVTITARDQVGNETKRLVMLYASSNQAMRSKESDEDSACYVRAINRENYEKHDGSSREADIRAHEDGALKAYSLWYVDQTYRSTIEHAFTVMEEDAGYVYEHNFDGRTLIAAR